MIAETMTGSTENTKKMREILKVDEVEAEAWVPEVVEVMLVDSAWTEEDPGPEVVVVELLVEEAQVLVQEKVVVLVRLIHGTPWDQRNLKTRLNHLTPG